MAIIAVLEIYYMIQINQSAGSAGPLEFTFVVYIALNGIVAFLLLLSETPPFSHAMESVKDVGPFLESVVKVIFVSNIGNSPECSASGVVTLWGTSGPAFNTLTDLIRADIAVAIVAAACRPYFPVIIMWINAHLRWINELIFSLALCIKERCYWLIFMIITFCRWIKKEMEQLIERCLHSCGHDTIVDWLVKHLYWSITVMRRSHLTFSTFNQCFF